MPGERGRPPSLGWDSRSLLVWAITGWALASLLGILLVFHVFFRGAPSHPEAPAENTSTVEAPSASDMLATETTATTSTQVPEPSLSPTPPVRAPAPPPSALDEAADDDAVVAGLLRHAAVLTEAGDFEEAIEAYDTVLARDPGNSDFRLLRSQVVEMRAASGRAATPVRLRETPTVFVASPGPGPRDDGLGVQDTNQGVDVQRATQAPEFPGELVIELRPGIVEPGDPYVLRVRFYNKGNRGMEVDSLEVVRTFGPLVEGRGDVHAPRVRRVNPRDTALLWEYSGMWPEGRDSGGIVVNVTLESKDRVTKSVFW